MDLALILDQVPSLNGALGIYARRPWTAESVADVAPLGKDGQVPDRLAERGLSLFLTVREAQAVLQALRWRGAPRDTKRKLLLHYAAHRSFPDWLEGLCAAQWARSLTS